MELPATYRTLQDLGDPLLLLHHVEVLPQVRRHVPAAEVVGVALVHAVEVALLGVVAGQGQGEGPRRLPHLHQAHLDGCAASYSSAGSCARGRIRKASACFTSRLSRQRVGFFGRKDTAWVRG